MRLIESKFDVKTIEKVTSESDNLNDHQRSSIINQYADIFGFTLYNMGYSVLPEKK